MSAQTHVQPVAPWSHRADQMRLRLLAHKITEFSNVQIGNAIDTALDRWCEEEGFSIKPDLDCYDALWSHLEIPILELLGVDIDLFADEYHWGPTEAVA